MIRVSVALLTSSQAGGQHSSLARFKVSGSNCFVSENFCHTRASTSCTVHVRSVADWQALFRLVSDVTLLTGSPAALYAWQDAWQDACILHHCEQSERVLGHAYSVVIMASRSRRVLSS